MTYDKNQDVLVILDQAHVRMTPNADGTGATEITSATATFARREKYVRFERGIKALRSGQIIEADSAVAHLTERRRTPRKRGTARPLEGRRPRTGRQARCSP